MQTIVHVLDNRSSTESRKGHLTVNQKSLGYKGHPLVQVLPHLGRLEWAYNRSKTETCINTCLHADNWKISEAYLLLRHVGWRSYFCYWKWILQLTWLLHSARFKMSKQLQRILLGLWLESLPGGAEWGTSRGYGRTMHSPPEFWVLFFSPCKYLLCSLVVGLTLRVIVGLLWRC